jgi:preprotein translocase SecE subunit
MAVAVKNASEAAPSNLFDRLAVSSLVGVVYVLGSIGIVFYAIPALWGVVGPGLAAAIGSFVSVALMVLLMVAVGAGLVYLGVRLVGPHPPHGLHAGIGVGIIGLLLIVFLALGFGHIFEAMLGGENVVGAIISLVFALGLLYGFIRLFFRPRFEETLIGIEDQGWFSRDQYKASQGQRVRRGTMAGVLILVGCGIYTLLSHHTLEAGEANWSLRIPFTPNSVTILPDVQFTVPLLLGLVGLWVAFRVVNFPTFADFLIATEAEMNKVSWTTRKRLWQDTIVVLTTVVLMTIFLMVVDLFWGWSLKAMKVLNIDDKPKAAKTVETDW